MLVSLIAGPASGEDQILKLLGFIPGGETIINTTDGSVPLNMERVPAFDSELKRYFPDLQLFLLVPEKRIMGIAGRKAMIDLAACENERGKIYDLLAKSFKRPYHGNDKTWQFESDDGAMVAKVECTRIKGNPYPLLEMLVQHLELGEVYEQKLREYSR